MNVSSQHVIRLKYSDAKLNVIRSHPTEMADRKFAVKVNPLADNHSPSGSGPVSWVCLIKTSRVNIPSDNHPPPPLPRIKLCSSVNELKRHQQRASHSPDVNSEVFMLTGESLTLASITGWLTRQQRNKTSNWEMSLASTKLISGLLISFRNFANQPEDERSSSGWFELHQETLVCTSCSKDRVRGYQLCS